MYGSLTQNVVLWKMLQESFETYKTFPRCIITEFESAQSTFKIMDLGGYVFRIGFFRLLNNDEEKYSKNCTVNQ